MLSSYAFLEATFSIVRSYLEGPEYNGEHLTEFPKTF